MTPSINTSRTRHLVSEVSRDESSSPRGKCTRLVLRWGKPPGNDTIGVTDFAVSDSSNMCGYTLVSLGDRCRVKPGKERALEKRPECSRLEEDAVSMRLVRDVELAGVEVSQRGHQFVDRWNARRVGEAIAALTGGKVPQRYAALLNYIAACLASLVMNPTSCFVLVDRAPVIPIGSGAGRRGRSPGVYVECPERDRGVSAF
jgi:hypothetical protein